VKPQVAILHNKPTLKQIGEMNTFLDNVSYERISFADMRTKEKAKSKSPKLDNDPLLKVN